MNSFLLDTHTFLWSLNAEEKLGDTARELLSMPENPVYVSSVTFWEISLKTALRKLTLENYSPDELPAIRGKHHGLPNFAAGSARGRDILSTAVNTPRPV